MATLAESAAPFAASPALRAARSAAATSSWAALASAAAFSAASLAFAAASTARSAASSACCVIASACCPSRRATATSSWICVASWSRARAMCWPVSRNHSTSESVPDRAREAYFCTSGPACTVSLAASTRMSSRVAEYCPAVRKVSSASKVPVLRAVPPARFTALPPVAIAVVAATRRSSSRAVLNPPVRYAATAESPFPSAAVASRRTPFPPAASEVTMETRLSIARLRGEANGQEVLHVGVGTDQRRFGGSAHTPASHQPGPDDLDPFGGRQPQRIAVAVFRRRVGRPRGQGIQDEAGRGGHRRGGRHGTDEAPSAPIDGIQRGCPPR